MIRPTQPRVLILRTAGINCDVELAHAFKLAGGHAVPIHLNTLIEKPGLLEDFDILAFPGGFSYGDDIAAGRIMANRIRHRLAAPLRAFVARGRPVIGICNGFQVLVKLGLLGQAAGDPGNPANPGDSADDLTQRATLADNAFPRFVDTWVDLRAEGGDGDLCIWTRGLGDLRLPIAHGEGRFMATEDQLDRLQAAGQIALRYLTNPNGAQRDIAGICDPTGVVFGLMPHPERYTHATNDPLWTRGQAQQVDGVTPGLKFFINAVQYVKQRRAAEAASPQTMPA